MVKFGGAAPSLSVIDQASLPSTVAPIVAGTPVMTTLSTIDEPSPQTAPDVQLSVGGTFGSGAGGGGGGPGSHWSFTNRNSEFACA
jgi:hypothetical protein